jgi:hypothetical protein
MGCSFKYAMIDKSPMEMSVLEELGIFYCLCLFHVLQEWERFLRSGESGAKAQVRQGMLQDLRDLASTANQAVFESKERSFLST